MQALFHDKHPLAFTSVVCVLGCLFPFDGVLLFFVFSTCLIVSFFIPVVRRELLLGCVIFSLSGEYYQQDRSAYEYQKQTLTNKSNLLCQVFNVQNNLAEIELVGWADKHQNWRRYSSTFRINYKLESQLIPEIGDYLFIPEARILDSNLSVNQMGFDLHSYLMGNNSLGYLQADEYQIIKTESTFRFFLLKLSKRLRKKWLTNAAKWFDPKLLELYDAAFLGNKKATNPAVKETFSKLGLMHVLSVSGMHVGLVYIFIFTPFRWFGKHYQPLLNLEIFILPVVWIYALASGFAEPVFRASMLISLLVMSRVLLRRKLRIEDAFFSVLLLSLIQNPLRIHSVSFQLSNAAMLGILFIYPIWKQKVVTPYALINRGLDIIGISISCSVSTLPLVLYYFHQFPLWFILGNLFFTLPFTLLMFGFTGFGLMTLFNINWGLGLLTDGMEIIWDTSLWLLEQLAHLPNPYVYAFGFNEQCFYVLACLLWLAWFIHSRFPIFKGSILLGSALFLMLFFGSVELPQISEMKHRFPLKKKEMNRIYRYAQSRNADTLILMMDR
jgi:ComEC/Rec2-related protein